MYLMHSLKSEICSHIPYSLKKYCSHNILYRIYENQVKYDKYYEHMFKYGNCKDDEREMTADGDVSWLIILDKHC